MRSDIQKMISENKVCVMATVADGAPHCSLMSYATDYDCCEIYVATLKDTKKYRNLTANPSVSLLIDTRDADPKGKTRALTVTGIVQTINNDKKIAEIRKALLKRHPDLNDFFNNPDAQIVVIKATALQLLDNVTDSYFEHLA
ncbi:pyridoxamine 5'-phosphate oxidase-related [hydrocarbon metagenome]|uniref:Pyridoxamine 5'-phosphate oxidase-related n=1 Tax=hydrocarbon metagenome TaxID=938273 RepID=A0A0W8FMP2_9ZZZZ